MTRSAAPCFTGRSQRGLISRSQFSVHELAESARIKRSLRLSAVAAYSTWVRSLGSNDISFVVAVDVLCDLSPQDRLANFLIRRPIARCGCVPRLVLFSSSPSMMCMTSTESWYGITAIGRANEIISIAGFEPYISASELIRFDRSFSKCV